MSADNGEAQNRIGNSLSGALKEAQKITDAAQERAHEIIADANAKLKAAQEKGYQDGFEAGKLQAAREAIRLIEDHAVLSEKISREAAGLAVSIANSIIGEHVKIAPDTVLKIATMALRESVVGDSVSLIVHPEDLELLQEASGELSRLVGGVRVVIETDRLLTRGGCVVKTEFGEVDASIKTLLSAVAERLELSADV